MIDKVGIKIDPKHTVFIQIGDTLPCSPYCKEVLQGIKNPIMSKKRRLEWSLFLNDSNRITYNSETMVVLESMQDGLIYSNLLMKMYLMSLKNNGILMLNDHIPHSPQTIATFTCHQIGTVERALKVFMELGLVEILTDGTYYMTDIQMLIGLSSTEGERKKRERMRLQQENLLPQTVVDICPPIGKVDKCPPILELEIEKELELKTEGELETGQTAPTPLGRYKNVILSDTELADLQTEVPTKCHTPIQYRVTLFDKEKLMPCTCRCRQEQIAAEEQARKEQQGVVCLQ